jgi:hypothetical protein
MGFLTVLFEIYQKFFIDFRKVCCCFFLNENINFFFLPLSHACLLNKPKTNKELKSYTRLYPGQIYNSFEQCKQLYGQSSIPCFVSFDFSKTVVIYFIFFSVYRNLNQVFVKLFIVVKTCLMKNAIGLHQQPKVNNLIFNFSAFVCLNLVFLI